MQFDLVHSARRSVPVSITQSVDKEDSHPNIALASERVPTPYIACPAPDRCLDETFSPDIPRPFSFCNQNFIVLF
jgi:hypothetical protein